MKMRGWQEKDATALRPMLLDFLLVGEGRGSDIAPTEANVERLLQMGIAAAARGWPSLVIEAGDRICAALLWVPLENGFELDVPTCLALGSYTREEYRHLGMATQLRETGFAMCRELGVGRITGTVQVANQRGIEALAAQGAVVTALVMSREV